MPTVIIVEDDNDINEIETIALTNIGYHVLSCSCAAEFWPLLGKHVPDLVLLDIMLEDEDGLTILKRSVKMKVRPVCLSLSCQPSRQNLIKSAVLTAVLMTILRNLSASWN